MAPACPSMIMTGEDWNRCYGEIFQIYQACGPRQVQSGDPVGLHYPNIPGQWLGVSRDCQWMCKDFMSGTSNHCKWICYTGSLVQMLGRSIQDLCQWQERGSYHRLRQWHHSLLYTRGNWVAQPDTGNTGKFPCPGTVRPPPLSRVDVCPSEMFKIRKRPNHWL